MHSYVISSPCLCVRNAVPFLAHFMDGQIMVEGKLAANGKAKCLSLADSVCTQRSEEVRKDSTLRNLSSNDPGGGRGCSRREANKAGSDNRLGPS